jgi:hypothetical protein
MVVLPIRWGIEAKDRSYNMEVGLEGKCRSFTAAKKGGDHNHVGKDTLFLSSFNPKKLAEPSSAAPAAGSLCPATENDLDLFFRFVPDVANSPLATLLFAARLEN